MAFEASRGEGETIAVPLRHQPEFLKFWAGQGLSQVGSQVTALALPLTAVLVLHATALEMGFINTAQWLPFLLLALWVGAVADRLRRKPLLIGADICRATVISGIAILGITGLLNVPILIVLIFVFGTCTVIFEVGYYSFVPSLVPRESLIVANGCLQATTSTAQIGGPSLGGALVQLFTAPIALLADGATFVVSAISLAWMRTTERQQQVAGSAIGQIREGLAVTFGNPYLRTLVGTSGIYNLFWQWIITLFYLYAIRRLGLSPGAIGLVLSAGAVGSLIGSVISGPTVRRVGVGPAVLWSVVIECAAFLVIPAAGGRATWVMPAFIAGFGINGVGTALSSVAAITVRQAITPDHMLGRMNASYRFVSSGAVPLGALLGGVSGDLLGLRAGLLAGVLGLLGTVAWVLFSPLPRLRTVADAAAHRVTAAPGRPSPAEVARSPKPATPNPS